MTLSEQYMKSHYNEARALFGAIFPPAPTWGEDFLPPGPNAAANLVSGNPYFAWRTDFPSAQMDAVLRASEIKRTARHEIGHPFEFLLALAFQKLKGWTYVESLRYVRGRYFTFRQYTGEWTVWEDEGREPREGFADCFGAALGGEWIVAVGSSQADRFFNEGKTVTWQQARAFFLAITQEAMATVPAPLPPPPTGGAMKVIDLRPFLPLATQNIPSPSHVAKNSNTVHWTGGHDTVTTDEQAVAAIKRWHQEHINKNWAASGYQGGAGLMYVEVLAPSGTVYLTRDPDAHTWHCSNDYGNKTSRAILVICDQDDLPTQAQFNSLEQRLTFPEVFPHQFWISTQCPGPQVLAHLATRGIDDMFTEADRAKLDRVYSLAEAREDQEWTQRLQDWLSKVFKSVPQYARPTDYSGPDVTKGTPRT